VRSRGERPGVPEEETESSRSVESRRRVSAEGTGVAGRAECTGLNTSEQVWGVILASTKVQRLIFTLSEVDPRLESNADVSGVHLRQFGGARGGDRVERGRVTFETA
jgi:hypothetical protein